MTRLQQHRAQQAKCRQAQAQLENALDDIIPSLGLKPSAAFEALLTYAVDGLVAQGTIHNKEQALYFMSRALLKRGVVG